MIRKKIKAERKCCGIAKIGFDKSTKQNICVKYRFNDLDNFLKFIQKKHNPFFVNIYFRTGVNARQLAYTWGRNKGLCTAT